MQGPASPSPQYPGSRARLGSRRPFPAPVRSGWTGPAPAMPGRGTGPSRGPGGTYLPPRRRGSAAAPPCPRRSGPAGAGAGGGVRGPMEGCAEGQRDAQRDAGMRGGMRGGMRVCKEGCADGWRDARRDARRDGGMQGGTEGCAEGRRGARRDGSTACPPPAETRPPQRRGRPRRVGPRRGGGGVPGQNRPVVGRALQPSPEIAPGRAARAFLLERARRPGRALSSPSAASPPDPGPDSPATGRARPGAAPGPDPQPGAGPRSRRPGCCRRCTAGLRPPPVAGTGAQPGIHASSPHRVPRRPQLRASSRCRPRAVISPAFAASRDPTAPGPRAVPRRSGVIIPLYSSLSWHLPRWYPHAGPGV